MEEMRSACKSLVGKAEGRDHFGDLGIDEVIILKRILRTWYEDMN
jgi:hypothetical protein